MHRPKTCAENLTPASDTGRPQDDGCRLQSRCRIKATRRCEDPTLEYKHNFSIAWLGIDLLVKCFKDGRSDVREPLHIIDTLAHFQDTVMNQ